MDTPVSPQSFGIYGVASVSPSVHVASPSDNAEAIISQLGKPELSQAQFVVFPELSISGYTCGDLFFQTPLLEASEKALIDLAGRLEGDNRLIAVGAPLRHKGRLYNCAVVICGGKILGVVPKSHIPNYQEFYEKRWFASGENIRGEEILVGPQSLPFGTDLIFSINGVKVGIEICEDLWVPSPPSSALCMAGAEIIMNLSATDDNIGKYAYIKSLVASQSGRCRCVYLYASAGSGESSTDLVFSGINLIASDGILLAASERFSREANAIVSFVDIAKLRADRMKYSTFYDERDSQASLQPRVIGHTVEWKNAGTVALNVDSHPFVPENPDRRDENCSEIVEMQSWGLAQRLMATGCRNLVVGISGGLDSTLALLIASYTFRRLNLDPKGIHGVTMPSEATSERTFSNASALMEALGVDSLEIPVKEAVELHFSQIGHDPEVFDAVYENSQARERTQILMDLANKYGGMVLGTGDLSELALGWCTYNGDHMSMYNVNGGVPKTLVKHLVRWFADTSHSPSLRSILLDIVDTPISPELIPAKSGKEIAQLTEELVGPYELHDFFLYHVLRNGFSPSKIFFLAKQAFGSGFSASEIKKWLLNFYSRFFSQQFKRSCMPDGPKIGSVCLSPRGDWRMPSDASARLWIKEAEALDEN